MKNWKLYDGNEQHKKRISGKEYDKYTDSYKDISYGVQKAWVYVEPKEPENGNDYVSPSLQEKVKNGEQCDISDFDERFKDIKVNIIDE